MDSLGENTLSVCLSVYVCPLFQRLSPLTLPVVTLKKKKALGTTMNPFSIKTQTPKVYFFSLSIDPCPLLYSIKAKRY